MQDEEKKKMKEKRTLATDKGRYAVSKTSASGGGTQRREGNLNGKKEKKIFSAFILSMP